MHFLLLFLATTIIVTALMLAGAWILHFIPTLGEPGQQFSAWLCRAPGLDCVVTYFTVAPIILGPIAARWAGLFGGVAGQVIGVLACVYFHERAHPDAVRGPRIVKVLNRLI